MGNHVQRHAVLVDVDKRASGAFSGMKGLVYFFANEVPNITNPKVVITTEPPMVFNYASKAYLSVRLYGKLIKDMGNNYSMGQDSYPQTLPKMQNLLTNCLHMTRTTPVLHLVAYLSPNSMQMIN